MKMIDGDGLHPIPFSFRVSYNLLERIERAAAWRRLSPESFVMGALLDKLDEIDMWMEAEDRKGTNNNDEGK